MPSDSPGTPVSSEDLQGIYQTLWGLSPIAHDLAARLEYLEDLMAKAGPISPGPVLLWGERDQAVQQRPLGQELVVGRAAEDAGLSFSADNLLSRWHFVIRAE